MGFVDWTQYPFQLRSLIQHLGETPLGGHYVTWVRRSADTWCLCDDLQVLPAASNSRGGPAYEGRVETNNYVFAFELSQSLPASPLVHLTAPSQLWTRHFLLPTPH
eukprot:Gregarina_sp_Poly_1__9303@NODE_577_length_7456_cov_92_259304_g451_i0_p6_GENE_NODE_577_length_7456_cov_92_259304_g451_i0NODE_577_length_7456_cov_92_259304_g451_i0_p6_ORF_typecomplete_len106_score8_90UCH/PF00443_29/1e07Peptidase_C98/PF15499_6/0_00014UCH_1/PF13423_6/0_012_NODE_577_length_7456_cov_92_259304_g451_i0553870